MKLFFLILLLGLTGILGWGQAPMPEERVNIVPNPGFELYSSPPIGWFYNGQHFTKVMKYWSAPTGASPDIFGPKVRVPLHWAEKDFGKQTPHKGESMIGITVFGCDEGKPHCREYVQIQLSEPLVPGQNYYAEFWASHLPRSLQIDNIGIHFAEEIIQLKTDELLSFNPQVSTEEIINGINNKWVKVSGRFKANSEASYLILGNFYPDSLTQIQSICDDSFPYAYYYIDDVLVFKEEPILPVPIKDDDLSLAELKPGKTIRLNNIFFETDKAELLPRSFIELKKLVQILEDHQTMIIEIQGHTDSRGDEGYNVDLSTRRAESVVQYLTQSGIDKTRVQFKGFGRSQPVATNQTAEGRQLNRRVEFLIIQK